MKKLQIMIVLLIAIVANVSAQSIRKKYAEMNQSYKKRCFCECFYQLINDLI